MEKLKELFVKYKEGIMYLFFGVCSTVVSIVCFYIFEHFFHMSATAANVPANFIAIVFAYVTNKLFVFESKTDNFKDLLKEIASFFSARLFTFLVEEVILFVFADYLGFNKMIIKVIGNVVVIVLNYVFSKLFIFKKKD